MENPFSGSIQHFEITEFTWYLILAVILLVMILSMRTRAWWKYTNLSIFAAYISISLFYIYSDPTYAGFVPMVITIIVMLWHIGILLLTALVRYARRGRN
jgi:hypothetical protein